MNIISTQYTLNTKAFEIYVSGCKGNPHCEGCFSPETWAFEQGEYFDNTYFEKLKTKITEFDSLIDNIMIFGGEPLDQDMSDFGILLSLLKDNFNKPIWVFTHYELEKSLEILGTHILNIDFLKCGAYIPALKVEKNNHYGINLATSNQQIYKLVKKEDKLQIIEKNNNQKITTIIEKRLEENKEKFGERYCPCSIVKDETTICQCQEFREMEEGLCHCQLYKKTTKSLK